MGIVSSAEFTPYLPENLKRPEVQEPPTKDACLNIYTTETIAYFNLAANLEQLNRWADAMRYYELALKVAEVYLPRGHALTLTVKGHID